MTVMIGLTMVLFAGNLPAFADTPSQMFAQANALYMKGDFSGAVQGYEKILHDGFENGELYFNLGDAYYKTGNIPMAILNYERAQKFMPGDDDLQFNLALANLQIVDKIDVVPRLFIYRWIDDLFSLFSLHTLAWSLYGVFLLTLSSFGYFLFASSAGMKRATLLGGMICSVILVMGIIMFSAQSYRDAHSEYAIIMADVANIKGAPDNSGNDVFVLHKGLKVQVVDQVDRWLEIRLADGKVGWIPDQDCEII
jgi:tetratricopeptide (TPR) repeat protein